MGDVIKFSGITLRAVNQKKKCIRCRMHFFCKKGMTSKQFAKNWGVKIVIGNYGDHINGSIQDGVIRLNAEKFTGKTKTQVLAKILAHEITHRMQETAPEAYAKYRDAALQHQASLLGGSLDGVIRDYQNRQVAAREKAVADARANNKDITPEQIAAIEADYPDLSREDAMDEIAADYTKKFVEDTEAFREFIGKSKEHRSLGRKLIDCAKAIVAKIKATFSSQKARDAASQEAFGKDLAAAEKALKLWEEAYAEGQKAVKNAPVRESTGEGVNKHSLNISNSYIYDKVSEEAKTGIYQVAQMKAVVKLKGDEFTTTTRTLVYDVTKFFEQIGGFVHNDRLGDVHLRKRGVKDDLAHGMTPEKASAFAAIPEVIRQGKVVFYEENRKKLGYDSATIAAPVEIAGEPYIMAVIVHRSNGENRFYIHDVYTEKEAAPFMTGTFKEGTPGGATSTASIIKLILNVKYKKAGDLVFDIAGRTLTPQQAEYFKDSKVRDKDGNLLVVYHGTGAIFNEFSFDFINTHGSAEGRGFYFTDSRSMAEGYARSSGRVMEGYLDIQKPLSNHELTITRQEVRKLIKAIDPTGDNILTGYDSSGVGYPSVTWYNRAMNEALDMLMTNDSDSELLAELANTGGGTKAVMQAAHDLLGYDGYIEQGKYDGASVYVALDSSQFKDFDNRTPTKSRDTRLSLAITFSPRRRSKPQRSGPPRQGSTICESR